MSLPHLLMLGLIDGASVGVVVQPPETVGELADLSIEQFYVVDYGHGRRGTRRKLTRAQYAHVRRLAAIMRRTKLRAIADHHTHREIQREMRAALR